MKDPLWGDKKVLKEVRNAFAEQGGGRVGVIIGVHRDYSIEALVKKLQGMRVKNIRHTDYYVSAKLTSQQVEKLSRDKMVFKIWHDREIKPLLDESCRTIKSDAAVKLFGGQGKNVSWAVLDTGIYEKHDYFKGNPVLKSIDGKSLNFTEEGHTDSVGHGTHVAGIIRKLAPQTKLYDFKVLGKGGSTSFTVIEAMYRIREINLQARQMIIHGANLSIGGPVQVGSYGCGFSPECQEANRLVNSGVVVCVAASNDGHKTLATITSGNELEYFPTFMDMGISDPGNAEDVITVGSTHKIHPHQYGISWFSSKGPTGDGRFKPDVVAPGERILSAGIGDNSEEVFLSGTSMATPHVSAAVALFLSVKPEFKEQPARVKKILMDTCTDLGRDRCFQGAGLIDVLRMIQSV
ncbi:MAG: S8 family peptidase [Candidatus Krumholzibacteriota bacterium]|nr:S8 family peptidase [Candidatus Krumholzibacteriota bacterium]